ncbi:MAG: hypothetical protein K0Q62_2309 [Phenylobacterium sp.]|nr:hypothetical protein [Phenylobacterium sp.]
MNKVISAAIAAAAITAFSFGTASAATTLSWNSGDTGVGYTQDFNGFVGSPEAPTVISGLTSKITYTLSSVGNGGKTWIFAYDIANTSSAPTTTSRISSFGFDVGSNVKSASSTGAYAFADAPSSNIPNGIGKVDVCFTAVSNGNCTGNGGGLTLGQSGSGFLTLKFGSGQSDLDLTSFYVRYQSVMPDDISNSASGVPIPGSAVPEPATWTMLIAGFGLAGSAIRRRRRDFALA